MLLCVFRRTFSYLLHFAKIGFFNETSVVLGNEILKEVWPDEKGDCLCCDCFGPEIMSLKTLSENKHFRDEIIEPWNHSSSSLITVFFLKTLQYSAVEALVNRLPCWNILIVLYDVQ
jgi:hypothetical protein